MNEKRSSIQQKKPWDRYTYGQSIINITTTNTPKNCLWSNSRKMVVGLAATNGNSKTEFDDNQLENRKWRKSTRYANNFTTRKCQNHTTKYNTTCKKIFIHSLLWSKIFAMKS